MQMTAVILKIFSKAKKKKKRNKIIDIVKNFVFYIKKLKNKKYEKIRKTIFIQSMLIQLNNNNINYRILQSKIGVIERINCKLNTVNTVVKKNERIEIG